ncbi:MAG: class I SAM-dependent methyltransferase [Candidatus Kerfeldbacteria bacterium]|nr:class I SAM-dependent methyltransferase [Candidatus Kerfeldbacteria bacterium]
MAVVYLLVLLLFCLALLLVVGTLAYGAISAAPWVPLPAKDVARLLALARLKPGELVYDLGCGDGRIIVAAARDFGVRAVGFEVAFLPYCLARLRVFLSGTAGLAEVRYQNFWRVKFTPADAVFCFLTPAAMVKLENKVASELRPGARFVSCVFKLPRRQAGQVSKPSAKDLPIYLYT